MAESLIARAGPQEEDAGHTPFAFGFTQHGLQNEPAPFALRSSFPAPRGHLEAAEGEAQLPVCYPDSGTRARTEKS